MYLLGRGRGRGKVEEEEKEEEEEEEEKEEEYVEERGKCSDTKIKNEEE